MAENSLSWRRKRRNEQHALCLAAEYGRKAL
jgi:hypothetical protein